MGRLERIGKNIIFYGIGKVYDAGSALVWIAIIARYLGRDGFGEYSLVWAVVTMALIIPEIGLNNVLIREVSKDRERAPELLKAAIQVRRFLSLFAILATVGVVFMSTSDIRVRASAVIGSIWIIGRLTMGTNSAIFFAFERIQYDTYVTIFQCSTVIVLLFLVSKTDWGLMGVIGATSVAAALGGILSFVFRRFRFCTTARGNDWKLLKYIMNESLPVGGSRALRLTGNRIDTLVLSWLRTSGEVAIYSGVYNMILRIINIPFLISRPLFPLISELAADPERKENLRAVTTQAIKIMVLFAVPVCLGLTITADKVVNLIFGPQFQDSIPVMRLLVWVLLFMFPSATASFVVIAMQRQVYLLKSLGVCIFLNIILDFALVPKFGYYGPCFATLLAEVLFAIFLLRELRATFPELHLFSGYAGILGAAAIMGVVLSLLHQINLIFLLLLGPLVYFASLFPLRTFSREEIQFMRQLFGGRKQKEVELQVGD